MNQEERTSLLAGIREAMKERDAEVLVATKKAQEDLERFGKVQEGTKDAIAELSKKGQELHDRLFALEQKVGEQRSAGAPQREKSAGEVFVESPELKEFVAAGGRGKGRAHQLKTITSLTGSGGSGIWSTRLPGVIEEPLRPLTIRALLDQGTTDSNLIEWVRENVYTSAADVVSEGTLKPESNITYSREDVPVRTIAHWILATRQVLADFKQLRTLIDGRLTWGLKIAEEDQLLLGDGTGENILGLIPQATVYSGAYAKSTDTYIDVIRHAILQVRLAFYPASGVVLNPVDWHNIELTKDNENRYLMAAPTGRAPAMLWGLPVVESDAMQVDEFLVGAFRMAATVFDREQASIMVSTEDGDNFRRNMVTILAEERLALAVSRPAAFVHGNFPAGSTT
jgi:HK97 family phage major capsid protein